MVVLAKVDCDEHSTLAERYKISKYPTIKYFINGDIMKSEYRGKRSADGFLEFVKEHMKEPHDVFNTTEEFDALDGKTRTIIGYFESSDAPEYKTFRKVAASLKDICKFHVGFGDFITDWQSPGLFIHFIYNIFKCYLNLYI